MTDNPDSADATAQAATEQPDLSAAMSHAIDPYADEDTIASLYQLWTLDVLSQIGPAAAQIYETNPRLFRRVQKDTSERLAWFRYRTGYSENALSSSQRSILLSPILGPSDGQAHGMAGDDFHLAANAMQTAAKEYVQRTFDHGEEELREAFRDSVTTFRHYMQTLNGSVVGNAYVRVTPYFAEVVKVLQDKEFAAGLGLLPAPTGGSWPFDLEIDRDGATLVEELTRRVGSSNGATPIRMDRALFTITQRVSHYGALTIASVINDGEPNDKKTAAELIGLTYRWKTALRDLSAEVETRGTTAASGSLATATIARPAVARDGERISRGRS